MLKPVLVLAAFLATIAAPAMAAPRELPLSVRNSFRIGDAGVLCTAQNAPADPRLQGIFDRGYRLTCRDAAGDIGTMIAVRRPLAIGSLASTMAAGTLACGEEGRSDIAGIGTVATLDEAVAAFQPTARRPGKTIVRVRP